MGKRRIEQKLGRELWGLGDAFNKYCPNVGPSYKDEDCGTLCDRLWHETDALCFYRDKDFSEFIGKAIDIALLALLLADRARRDA